MHFLKFSNTTYLFLLLLFSVVLFYFNFSAREYGWDMPGYLGSYYQLGDHTNDEILQNVYSSIKAEAPIAQYDKMVGYSQNGNWNDFISKNADAFRLQIPYYSIKVLYVFFIFCFIKLGFTAPIAVFLPNLISFSITGFLMYAIFRKIFKNWNGISFILSILLLLLPPLRYLATIPSPDMLSLLFLTWFIYSVLQKHRLYIQAMILMLVIFTRPDCIVFCLSYLAFYFLYDFLKNRKFNFQAVIYGFLMIGIYMAILKINHYPGWGDVFYDSFIQRRKFITADAHFSFTTYYQILLENVVNFKKITLLAIVFFGVILYFSKSTWMKFLSSVIFINIYLKFIFFPAPGEYRFFISFLILLFIIAIYTTKDQITNLINKITFTASKN